MPSLKQLLKNSMDHDSIAYNALAWVYGAVVMKPSIRRAALIRASKDGRFDESELWMASGCPRNVLDAVVEKWQPRTLLDVGCGVGLAMEHLMTRGVECLGLEGSEVAVRASSVKNHIVVANLNFPVSLDRTFDVVWSYEVAEHIHPKYANAFLDVLTRHGNIVVMSAAPPGQGGCGHFNEQPQSYWVDRLAEREFEFDRTFSEHLRTLPDDHARNMMVFLRRQTEGIAVGG